MQYRVNPKNGDRLSVLGYGCMRFSRTAGVAVNQKKTEEELSLALSLGVNYFDTAYLYPGSEAALGKFLSKGHRKDVFVATKLPFRQCKKPEDFEKLFSEQKERLQTDYIDYYMVHMLGDIASWKRLVSLGIVEWAESKKASDEIRQFGFSYHGGTAEFKELIDAYDWDFCQIQINYFDAHTQAGIAGMKYAAEKGLPVFVMEPLRGGSLVNLPKRAAKVFSDDDSAKTPVEQAFRWLWNFEEITVVLSGMNSISQVGENCASADSAKAGSLSDAELAVFDKVCSVLNEEIRVPCTSCGYCMPCPHGVDIPSCFSAYNIRCTQGWFSGMLAYVTCTSLKEKPAAASSCVNCGLCERKCPQGILIRDYLDEVKAVMEGRIYRMALPVVKKFLER